MYSRHRKWGAAPAQVAQDRKTLRLQRSGPDIEVHEVKLEVVTPIFGGGAKAGMIDRDDLIRGTTIRGALRFWWRALRAHTFATPQDLSNREQEIFGGMAGSEAGRPSAFRLVVKVAEGWSGSKGDVIEREQYAFWPLERDTANGTLWVPGADEDNLQFTLAFYTPGTLWEDELEPAIKAWVLFGGYGGRTRRGAGSLSMVGQSAAAWLPESATREQLRARLGPTVFDTFPPEEWNDVPILKGARMWAGNPSQDAPEAMRTALAWLKGFRQGSGATPSHARAEGTQANRPGRSRWPEPDKLRRLTNHDPRHPPRPEYDASPAWPRAGFGLPIVGKFKDDKDPPEYEITWRSKNDHAKKARLASPVIVKPMALTNGRYVPIILWLARAYPENAEVVVYKQGSKTGLSDGTEAPFDRLCSPDDEPVYAPLAAGRAAPTGIRLQTAFAEWLRSHGVGEVL